MKGEVARLKRLHCPCWCWPGPDSTTSGSANIHTKSCVLELKVHIQESIHVLHPGLAAWSRAHCFPANLVDSP